MIKSKFITYIFQKYLKNKDISTLKNNLFYYLLFRVVRSFLVNDIILNINNYKIYGCIFDKLLDISKASIKFQNINFSYKSNLNNIVLKNINIDIAGRKMTALVGHSGSGKSTILNLIPRIYDADSGEIFIDNQKVQNP